MNILKFKLILLLILLYAIPLHSQSQIGLFTSIDYGSLVNANNSQFFDSNSTFGIGVTARKELNSKVYLGSSIAFQKVGWYSLDYDTASKYDLYWKGNALNVSGDIGYYIFNNPKFKFGTSGGLNIGIILGQNYQIIENANSTTEFYTKQLFLYSLVFNCDFVFKISETSAINLRPNWNQYIHFRNKDYVNRNLGLEIILMISIN